MDSLFSTATCSPCSPSTLSFDQLLCRFASSRTPCLFMTCNTLLLGAAPPLRAICRNAASDTIHLSVNPQVYMHSLTTSLSIWQHQDPPLPFPIDTRTTRVPQVFLPHSWPPCFICGRSSSLTSPMPVICLTLADAVFAAWRTVSNMFLGSRSYSAAVAMCPACAGTLRVEWKSGSASWPAPIPPEQVVCERSTCH